LRVTRGGHGRVSERPKSRGVELTQPEERVRQLQEENRRDQSLIAETYRRHGAVEDAAGRIALNREVGEIHRRIAVRGQQLKGLRERIGRLEAEAGPLDGAKKAAK
jgi:predicted  nucleic acid-binding Zn-ribbon protein